MRAAVPSLSRRAAPLYAEAVANAVSPYTQKEPTPTADECGLKPLRGKQARLRVGLASCQQSLVLSIPAHPANELAARATQRQTQPSNLHCHSRVSHVPKPAGPRVPSTATPSTRAAATTAAKNQRRVHNDLHNGCPSRPPTRREQAAWAPMLPKYERASNRGCHSAAASTAGSSTHTADAEDHSRSGPQTD